MAILGVGWTAARLAAAVYCCGNYDFFATGAQPEPIRLLPCVTKPQLVPGPWNGAAAG